MRCVHIIDQTDATISQQADALKEDKETVTAVESVLTAYEGELKRELAPRLAEVENILSRLQARGLDFVVPYTRFVRSERDRMEKAQGELVGLRQRVAALQARVDLI